MAPKEGTVVCRSRHRAADECSGVKASVRVPIFSPLPVEAQVDLGAAVARVLGTQRYILGSEVEQFERAFAAYCGTEYGVGVANGTDALELALRALGVAIGIDVLVVANAGYYGSAAARSLGAIHNMSRSIERR